MLDIFDKKLKKKKNTALCQKRNTNNTNQSNFLIEVKAS